ncbi:MAG: ROK family protein, partial [Bacteroidales bacterium]|nr:ROK family protein [Bacteroidales bacterium]
MMQKYAIGVDIGGSHITCAAVNLETGEIIRKTLTERRVNNQAQAFEIINIWSESLSEVI